MKTCFKCGKEKPLSEFYKHKQMSDGHLGKCKQCAKSDVTKHRKENIVKIREYDRCRDSMPHRKAKRKEYHKRYIEAFPEKYKANHKVNNALRDGKLSRPDKCDGCGIECKPHAHHWSYEEEHWLDVEWLCVVCHMQLHHSL